MRDGAWVASDTTDYRFTNQRPDWISLVSVAIAVDDISQFNTEYFEIVGKKAEEHGIALDNSAIKNQDISKWVPEWKQEEVRRDIIKSLLEIDTISNIQLTETSLNPQWITLFESEDDRSKRVEAQHFVNQILKQYYNLSSIWVYLKENDEMPWGHRNVMTDQFNGKITQMWNDICERSDSIRIVPHGDQTYPLLSLADLTMNFAKQEVEEWEIGQIHNALEENTPDNSAFVDSNEIVDGEELEDMIPYTTSEIRTRIHYPHPVIYIDSEGVKNELLESSDLYEYACEAARKSGGCVKFFDQSSDEEYLTSEDYLICANDKTDRYKDYERLNDEDSVEVLGIDDAFETLNEILE